MKKTTLLLLLALSPVVAGYAQSTLRREIPTTSAISRQALTNETAAGWRTALGVDISGGTNGLTSIGLTAPSPFVVSGSPLTANGTLSLLLPSQTANTVFAGPNGVAGAPDFRALLAADIPSLDAGKTASGVFSAARLGSGTPSASTYLRGDGFWVATGWSQQASALTNVFNVLDYGADPTGVQFSGTNIQRAIDAACTNGGGVVYFPAGTYLLGNHLPWGGVWLSETYPASMMVWSNNVVLRGAGAAQTVIRYGTNTLTGGMRTMLATPQTNTASLTAAAITNLTVEDLTLNSDNLGTAQSLFDTTEIANVFGEGAIFRRLTICSNANNDAIDITGTGMKMRVEDVWIHDFAGDAIHPNSELSVQVNNVICERIAGNVYECINGSGENILNNVVGYDVGAIGHFWSLSTLISDSYFYITGTNVTTINAGQAGGAWVHFSNCEIYDTKNSGEPQVQLYGSANRHVAFENCRIRSAGRSFLYATNSANVTMRNCQFGSAMSPQTFNVAWLSKATDAEFSHNLHYGSGTFLVATNGIERLKFIGNTLRGGAVVLSEATNAILANNVFTSSATLNITNLYNSTITGLRGATANLFTSGGNLLSGNQWTGGAPTSDCYTNVFGDWDETQFVVNGNTRANGRSAWNLSNTNNTAIQQLISGADNEAWMVVGGSTNGVGVAKNFRMGLWPWDGSASPQTIFMANHLSQQNPVLLFGGGTTLGKPFASVDIYAGSSVTNANAGTNVFSITSTDVRLNAGAFQQATNAVWNWPTAPATGGGCAFVNSNGTVYLLTSLPDSLTWAATNKIAP